MDKIVFADGREVELSAETVRKFKIQLGIPLFDQVIVDRFRAVKITETSLPIFRVALVRPDVEWDGESKHAGVDAMHLLTRVEVLQIITGLQRLTENE